MTSYISSGVSLLQDTATAAMHRVRAMGETATTVARVAMTGGITLASRTAAAGAVVLSGSGLFEGAVVASFAMAGAIAVRTVDDYMGGKDYGEYYALVRESIVSAAITSVASGPCAFVGIVFIMGMSGVATIGNSLVETNVDKAIHGACMGTIMQQSIRGLWNLWSKV